MTNYNKRLDKIFEQAYIDGASDTMWQNDRHVEIFATAKQAITALIKELVAEAKPKNNWLEGSDLFYGQDEGVGEFEQNLLKALEEV